MDMYYNNLRIEADGQPGGDVAVPLATEADFELFEDLPPRITPDETVDSDSYAFHNADTCPDCSSGMIRLGKCCACPSCGFESCVV